MLSRPTMDRASSGTLACANCDFFILYCGRVVLLLRRTHLVPEYVTTRTTTCCCWEVGGPSQSRSAECRKGPTGRTIAARSQTGWGRLSWARLRWLRGGGTMLVTMDSIVPTGLDTIVLCPVAVGRRDRRRRRTLEPGGLCLIVLRHGRERLSRAACLN